VFSPEMATYFRIVQVQWSLDAMSGEGARRYGGRWNPPGIPAVYLAGSRALAALEIMVHVPRQMLQVDWRIIRVEVPDDWIEEAAPPPPGWRKFPVSDVARSIGGPWLVARKAVALRLPSAIIPQEHTLLVNPAHTSAGDLQVSDPELISFDARFSA
jgi:RES domain-containing protein